MFDCGFPECYNEGTLRCQTCGMLYCEEHGTGTKPRKDRRVYFTCDICAYNSRLQFRRMATYLMMLFMAGVAMLLLTIIAVSDPLTIAFVSSIIKVFVGVISPDDQRTIVILFSTIFMCFGTFLFFEALRRK